MNCQQTELYAAERRVPVGRTFANAAEIQRFVDGLRETWWWQQWYPQILRVEAYGRPSGTRSSVGSWHPAKAAGKIEMLPVHFNELIVLHELAHVLAEARYGSKSHDPYFARTYLELVALVMGPDSYQQLYDAFNEAGIKHDADDYGERLGLARRMPAVSDTDLQAQVLEHFSDVSSGLQLKGAVAGSATWHRDGSVSSEHQSWRS